MKTVALIYPKISFKDNYPCNWIPFSILSIGSAMPKQKYQVLLFDENEMDRKEILAGLADKDILLVGISIMTGGGQIKNALELSKEIKNTHPEARVVFGGPHANVLPEQTVQCGLVDYVICGMGQNAFPALVECLSKGLSVNYIPGVYSKKEGAVVCPEVKKSYVDGLRPYDFSLIDPEIYIRYDATISDRTLNYIASQGCPYGCRFCYECSYDRKYYCMGAENIQRDLQLYAEKFRVNGIKFYDADFFVDKLLVDDVIRTLDFYGMKWAASIHPRDILRNQKGTSNTLLASISKSHCTRLLMGMESGSDRILNEVIHKKTRSEDYLVIAKTIAEYGILGSYTFMVGFPGETEEEREETFALVQKLFDMNIPIETKIHIYLPYPGTPLYEQALMMGYQPPDCLEGWSDYNYYKAMTPWTDVNLEKKLDEYTHMIDKNKRRNE